MYQKAYGIIETLAPLHVGASAGEETGNLNLIFRDQFTQTGIIPGSSIRGRFRADMRGQRQAWLEQQLADQGIEIPDPYQQDIEVEKDGKTTLVPRLKWLESQAKPHNWQAPNAFNEHLWYGHEAVEGQNDGGTTEALVKFEYASLLWLPVFCPGQPVVWVSSPRLLARYKLMNPSITATVPDAYTAAKTLEGKTIPGEADKPDRKLLFFNLGYLEIPNLVEEDEITPWIQHCQGLNAKDVVIVDDNDIAMIHDMALFRQTRVKLADTEKKVAGGAFFNVEALPEGSYLAFPVALKLPDWQPFGMEAENKRQPTQDLYFGGLESIGFGHCRVTLGGV
ncbi:RAMP superfamily CRISPR-associated protein [Nodosilinea sp. P-1105]|uniref:RAMP superfamily CRISPR-associated protein n=1 Tax=Nodosilinea sp. P-1105 TaxID=2546229 RepID=UPI00146AB970|nr:RAMP superfamily CRISPR-associated protein [Nodosilinea sp. P-1105]NMF83547.1 type III-B CRISPR module RAMP protein Cmr4 [Nodosilinea sp. P-1105]